MHGNVSEWCQDTWHESYKGAPSDGSAWTDNDNQDRVLRGGSWYINPEDCLSANRSREGADYVFCNGIGFRVVCDFSPMTLYSLTLEPF
ncbi:MAG: SUMF1/EgtB/PvdO family nonheme iron enzyme [Cyanomargarita calcarea GSE-NOS-MK-12-04C]|jgi:formylglycine-generating enzyme required for sulfatase activity|uniref:SUMF1/EgtB/PvdO family nonheme iron enzyme n=1 Tax=Cyanomargarita calcarea GSE-NOS-MK-12-04C TaxID=2839659 RepID=A0A951UUN0_9CYAN|nr:SUMF1/EgtB/PvdO family nonheme iron enzyme [Cyanomargarita calcarea GSE-NOS-MK-12-04C]